ncbi:MAG: 3-dehydroquinate synthase [Pyrinomonadaceae bacterium]
MKPLKLSIDLTIHRKKYEIVIGSHLLERSGGWVRRVLRRSCRIAVVSNTTVFDHYGERFLASLSSAGFAAPHFLLKDGEQYKTLRSAEALLKFLADNGIARSDAVLALGGGVVGDISGFASAIYLRGVPFLQIPTTLLAMIDSSVGGKTGVNSTFGKNLIGAFHQPAGVLIDIDVLSTLPRREMTAGMCEAVKQGAIGSRELLAKTSKYLIVNSALGNSADGKTQLADLIRAHVAFKAKIVAADERESIKRKDSGSRKILNFGHTLAHALEKLTSYKYFKHGEAVGYGIIFAAELSKRLALCAEKDVKLLNDVVQQAGALPPLPRIDPNEVFEAFRFDKKRLDGSLQMVLLKGIGKPVIVDERDIPPSFIKQALKDLLQPRA